MTRRPWRLHAARAPFPFPPFICPAIPQKIQSPHRQKPRPTHRFYPQILRKTLKYFRRVASGSACEPPFVGTPSIIAASGPEWHAANVSRTKQHAGAARAAHRVHVGPPRLRPIGPDQDRAGLEKPHAFPFIASCKIAAVLSRMIRGSTGRPSISALRTSLPEMKTGFSSGWLSIRSTRPSDS